MIVSEVKNSSDRKQFLQFPQSIYHDNPYWCAQPYSDQLKLIDGSHPFLKHGYAACFIVRDQNATILGRMMLSEDPISNAYHKEKVACLGLFECVDQSLAAHALFDKAQTWTKERGLSELRGPVNFSSNYPIGLLTNAYDQEQRVLMPYNPPYYVNLFEGYGFTKAKDLWSWWEDFPKDQSTKIEVWGNG